MIRLLSLEIEGIGRFLEKQSIDFTSSAKIIQVDGKNSNTGGSSGSGKSTIFNSIEYLFGINDIPANSLYSRLPEVTKNPRVSGIFDIDGIVTTITRSKKDGLVISYDGDVIQGNNKIAEEKLDALLGISRKLFKKMIHKKQKEGGFFLNLTPKETYDFLLECLNLRHWNDRIDQIDQQISSGEVSLRSLEDNKASLINQISSFNIILQNKIKPTVDFDESLIDVLKTKRSGLLLLKEESEISYKRSLAEIVEPQQASVEEDENITRLESGILNLKKKLSDINSNKSKIIREITDSAHSKQKEITALKNILKDIEFTKLKLPEISAKIKELNRVKEHLKLSTCPTCNQGWMSDDKNAKLVETEADITKLITNALSFKKDIDREESVKQSLAKLEKELESIKLSVAFDTLDSEIQFINDKILSEQQLVSNIKTNRMSEYLESKKEYDAKVNALKDLHLQQERGILNEISAVSMEISNKELELSKYKEALATYEKEIVSITNMLQEKNTSLNVISDNILNLLKHIDTLKETKRLIKTYNLHVFEDSLTYIGNRASEILSNIPNMSSAFIYFEGFKQNKSGSIKEEVNAILSVDGEQEVSIKTLSGGERTAIDLAVDLAVVDLIELRSGKGANFLVLDEPFDGLDSVCKERCLEMLKSIDTNKKILIVDHGSELKEMIEDTITVTRKGDISFINQQ